MAGNRKHGFMRGNSGGRRMGSYYQREPFDCCVCKKQHGASVERTLVNGKFICDRKYHKMLEESWK